MPVHATAFQRHVEGDPTMRKFMLGMAPLMMVLGGSAAAAEPLWKVSEVSGDVRLVQNGRTQPAVKGALLGSGSTIATGPNAIAVIVRGEEFVVISPRTQLRVPGDAAPNRIMQLIEDFGTALFKIEKKSTPHFGVQTPYLAAVVKGTTFTVTADAKGGSVQVTEGAVQVSTLDGGAAELVHPGTIAMVGASDLFRLSVDGETSKIIRSPNAPETAGSTAGTAAYAGPQEAEVRIASRLQEDGRSLKETTNGLVEGQSVPSAVQAEFSEQARAAEKDHSNPGNGGGTSNPADDGKPGPGTNDGKDKPGQDHGTPPDDPKPSPPDPGQKPSDPGKPDNGKPDQGDDAKPGKDDDGMPDKGDDAKPGKDDDGKPDKGDDAKPGKDDDGKPDKGDDGKPGKDDDGEAGKDDGDRGTEDGGKGGKD
jgi:hypothetical protein